ncbi:MAG: hypothetical protein PVH92_12020 [Anaerolineales bacterium]
MVYSRVTPGGSVSIHDYEIRPLARNSSFFASIFGFAWLRPEAVEVRQSNGSVELIRIQDRTRILQVFTTFVFTITAWQFMRTLGRN